MNTKDVGNLGEHIAIVEFLKRDIQVSRPLGDNSRYDLILHIEDTLLTCQVKSTNSSTEELAEFSLSSSQAHRGGGRKTYDVDVFCLVDIKKMNVFLIHNEGNKSGFKIRYVPTKSGQLSGINKAEDFTIDKFIENYF
jgi:hypothetical protein